MQHFQIFAEQNLLREQLDEAAGDAPERGIRNQKLFDDTHGSLYKLLTEHAKSELHPSV